jgi:hypothetical protein
MKATRLPIPESAAGLDKLSRQLEPEAELSRLDQDQTGSLEHLDKPSTPVENLWFWWTTGEFNPEDVLWRSAT